MNSTFFCLHRLLIAEPKTTDSPVIAAFFKTLQPRPEHWEITRCDTLPGAIAKLGARCLDMLVIHADLLMADPSAEIGKVRVRFPSVAIVVVCEGEDDQRSELLFAAGVQEVLHLKNLSATTFYAAIHACRLRQQALVGQAREYSALERRYDDQVGYLKGLIDKTRDGIVIIDQKGVVKFANPSALELFGRPAEQLVGCYFGYPLGTTQALELGIKTATGLATVEMRVNKIEWENSVAFLASLRDVTRYKELAESSKTAEEAAHRASKQKSQFLATMSHEIRTPLNGLLGMARLVQETAMTNEQRELVNTIQSSGEVLLQLISDILDLSKIEAGMIEFEHKAFKLREVVDDTIALYAQAALTKHLLLASVIAPGVPVNLIGDKVRFRQVLGNLVSNAIKYTDKGQVLIRILLEGHGANNGCRLRIEIEDSGVGIAPAKFRDLFEPFRQVGERVTEGGTGLGLSIAKQLVELLGGEIGCNSRLGEGSKFYFRLPFLIDEGEEPASGLAPGSAAPRVLVISAEGERRAIFEEQFAVAGFRCTGVESADEAKRCAEAAPDLFVLDAVGRFSDHGKIVELARSLNRPLLRIESERALGRDEEEAFVIRVPIHHDQLIETALNLIRHGGRISPLRPRSKTSGRMQLPRCRPGFKQKLLIAEDNPVNQQVVCKFLGIFGLDADVASNGQEALDKVMATKYAAVLMDCRMPQMDGLQATRLIRALEPRDRKSIPIIALTANAMASDKSDCVAAGMDGFLAKPLRIDDLAKELERVLPEAFARGEHQLAGATAMPQPRPKALTRERGEALIDDAVFNNFVETSKMAGDDGFMVEVLKTLVQQGRPRLARLADAARRGDWTATKHYAHSLRGSCSTFGAKKIAAYCLHLEGLLGAPDLTPKAAEQLARQISRTFHLTVQELRRRMREEPTAAL